MNQIEAKPLIAAIDTANSILRDAGFDFVQIVAGKYERDEAGDVAGTHRFSRGTGDLFARLGLMDVELANMKQTQSLPMVMVRREQPE